jgi:5-hydroxyisourate hydrolase-like protein (transthyretin family)
MKKIIFVLCIILLNKNILFSDDLVLTETRISKYIEISKEYFYNFYSNIALLLDNSIDENVKTELILDMLGNVNNYKSLIKNDMQIIGMPMNNYTIEEYLNNLSNSNGNQKDFFFNIQTKINTPVVLYKDSKSNKYYTFINYNRKIEKYKQQLNGENNEKDEILSSNEQNMLMSIYTTDGKRFVLDKFGVAPQNFDPTKNGFSIANPTSKIDIGVSQDKSYYIFNITPSNASLFVDEVEIDYAKGEKIPIDAGQHTIKLYANGYEIKELSSNINANETKEINITLLKQKGKLALGTNSSESVGANCYIESLTKKGFSQTTTLPSSIELEQGTYKLTFTQKDYFKKTEKVNIYPNKITSLNTSLKNKAEVKEKTGKVIGTIDKILGTNLKDFGKTDNNTSSNINTKSQDTNKENTYNIQNDKNPNYGSVKKFSGQWNNIQNDDIHISNLYTGSKNISFYSSNYFKGHTLNAIFREGLGYKIEYRINDIYIDYQEVDGVVIKDAKFYGYISFRENLSIAKVTIYYQSGVQIEKDGTKIELKGRSAIGTFNIK